MNMNRKRIIPAVAVLLVPLAIGIAVLGRGKETDEAGKETESFPVMEYVWDVTDGDVSRQESLVVEKRGEDYYVLYDNGEEAGRIGYGRTKRIMTSVTSGTKTADPALFETPPGADFEIYYGTMNEIQAAVAWLEERGYQKLCHIRSGDYTDVYYRYQGRTWRLLVIPEAGAAKASVLFGALGEEAVVPEKQSVRDGFPAVAE